MPNPTPSDLLEVAANGAMPHVYFWSEREVWRDPFFGQVSTEVVIDLARIGMVDWLYGKFPGMHFRNDHGATFQVLLQLCREHDDWRTDAGGGASQEDSPNA